MRAKAAMRAHAKGDMDFVLTIKVKQLGIVELAGVEIGTRDIESQPVALLKGEATKPRVLRDATHRDGEAIAAEKFLGRLDDELGVGAQLVLQLRIHRKV